MAFGSTLKWRDVFGASATLFFGLIKNHPFHDANKRTALLTAIYQLQCHGRIVSVTQKEFEDLAVRVAENALDRYPDFRDLRGAADAEVLFIARFFKRKTRLVDKREFRVTYRQLSVILARHGLGLTEIHDNRVDVVRYVEERHGLLGLKKRRVPKKLATIGFRDWGTEVSIKDMRVVRKVAGLTQEDGYDTAVLTQGLSPMEALISKYAGPLRRLAHK